MTEPKQLSPNEGPGLAVPSDSPGDRSIMTNPLETIRRWRIVVLVTTLFYSAVTAFYLLAPGASISVFSWLFALVTILFWAGTILLLRNRYSAARAVLLVGGILALPIGAIMIIAGARLKRAESSAFQIVGQVPRSPDK